MAENQAKIERGTTSPKHTLEETMGFLKTIDQNYGARAVSKDAIAEALGHSPTSSAGAVKVGSLTHFGLLKRNGNVYEPSQLAKDILYPKSDSARVDAVVKAAKSPSLYRRLFADFSNKALPQMLENILHRDYGVARANAKDVVKNFTATAQFTGLLEHGVIHQTPVDCSGGEPSELDEGGDGGIEVQQTDSRTVENVPHESRSAPSTAGMSSFAIPLSRKRTAMLSIPRPVGQADLERIVKWIDLMTDVLTEEESEDEEKAAPEVIA